jgi:transposase, IS30 family
MVMAGSRRFPRERVRAFWRARLAGVSVADAAALVGVSETRARSWIAESGGMIPDLAEPSGWHLSLAEREEIAEGWAAGLSKSEIARGLGRHRSTIGRELKRNQTLRHPKRAPRPDGQQWRPGPEPGTNRGQNRPQHERLRYRASVAHAKAEQRGRRSKPTKLAGNQELHTEVATRLRKLWSPEQISRTLERDFLDRPEMQVSHETIYQALYVQGRGQLRRELSRCLRTGRAVRRPRRLPDQRKKRTTIPDTLLISHRPAEAEDRVVPGHWEGDLIIGKDSGSAIGTLVERSSRFVMLLHLPGQHGAEQVRDAMITAMGGLPEAIRRSLTWDQGKELTRHAEITFALDLPIYFCDPHSPWQRGSNENTNGLLRQYFPKGTDLSRHSRDDLDLVADQLNARPRKTHAWDSPAEVLTRLLSRPVTTGVAITP